MEDPSSEEGHGSNPFLRFRCLRNHTVPRCRIVDHRSGPRHSLHWYRCGKHMVQKQIQYTSLDRSRQEKGSTLMQWNTILLTNRLHMPAESSYLYYHSHCCQRRRRECWVPGGHNSPSRPRGYQRNRGLGLQSSAVGTPSLFRTGCRRRSLLRIVAMGLIRGRRQ